jgi:hypothetical protein
MLLCGQSGRQLGRAGFNTAAVRSEDRNRAGAGNQLDAIVSAFALRAGELQKIVINIPGWHAPILPEQLPKVRSQKSMDKEQDRQKSGQDSAVEPQTGFSF